MTEFSEPLKFRDAPTVSIIIPCYNGQAYVQTAIESALAQCYPHKDVIVIDDGSADGSVDVIRSFGQRIRWETNVNQGAGAARNRGLELARGTFALFLDADDYLEGRLVEGLVLACLGEQSDLALGPFSFEYSGGMRLRGPTTPTSAEDLLISWLGGAFVASCSVLWRTGYLKALGGWRNVPRNDDGELIFRAMLSGAVYAVSPKGQSIYVQHDTPGRVSGNRSRASFAAELEIFEAVEIGCRTLGWDRAMNALGAAYYELARVAFRFKCDDLGGEALRRAAALGQSKHLGTISHRISSAVLGLRYKERLSSVLRYAS